MTGPDIFRARRGFTIGVSAIGGPDPIGDVQAFDLWTTVLSQYANSPILTRLLENMDSYLDQTGNFQDFFDLIMNVDTAEGYGLDVWGRIVGIGRVLTIGDGIYFGFEQQSPAVSTFAPGGAGPFFSGEVDASGNFRLSDASFRVLILAKALANICDGSIPSMNQILLNLFPNRGKCYVTDGLDMTMTYTFEFALTAVEAAIVTSGVLPSPTGVSVNFVQLVG